MLVLNFIGNSRRALWLKNKLGKLYQPVKQWHVVFEVANTHQIIFYSERPVLSSDNDNEILFIIYKLQFSLKSYTVRIPTPTWQSFINLTRYLYNYYSPFRDTPTKFLKLLLNFITKIHLNKFYYA